MINTIRKLWLCIPLSLLFAACVTPDVTPYAILQISSAGAPVGGAQCRLLPYGEILYSDGFGRVVIADAGRYTSIHIFHSGYVDQIITHNAHESLQIIPVNLISVVETLNDCWQSAANGNVLSAMEILSPVLGFLPPEENVRYLAAWVAFESGNTGCAIKVLKDGDITHTATVELEIEIRKAINEQGRSFLP